MPKKEVPVQGTYLSPAEARRKRIRRKVEAMTDEERGAFMKEAMMNADHESYKIAIDVGAEKAEAEVEKQRKAAAEKSQDLFKQAVKMGLMESDHLVPINLEPVPHTAHIHYQHQLPPVKQKPMTPHTELVLKLGTQRVKVGTVHSVEQRMHYVDTNHIDFFSLSITERATLTVELASTDKRQVLTLLGYKPRCGSLTCAQTGCWTDGTGGVFLEE